MTEDDATNRGPADDRYHDFTIERFVQLCRDARDRYRFLRFSEATGEPGVLWRHDIDVSIRAASRIAEVEADIGVRATYHFLPHSHCYNLGARDQVDLARRIVALGHDAGLHFDPSFYDGALSLPECEELAGAEKDWLQDLLDVEISSISFHTPTVGAAPPVEDRIAGMVNANGRRVSDRYQYVSDSNGVWRSPSLLDLIASGRCTHLHALTHPVWWSEEPMAPRRRLQECIDEAAAAMGKWYDDITARHGRPNIW